LGCTTNLHFELSNIVFIIGFNGLQGDIEKILDKPVLHKIVLSNDINNKKLGEDIVGMPAVKFLT